MKNRIVQMLMFSSFPALDIRYAINNFSLSEIPGNRRRRILKFHSGPMSSNPIGTLLVSGGFASRGNVLRTCALKNFLGSLCLVRTVRVHGKQNPAILNATFIPFGLVLWNSHSNQSSSETADCASHARPCKSRHNRACGYERSKSWNGQGSYPY